MRRTASIAVALLAAFLFFAPAAIAADPSRAGDRVLMAVNGDVTVPPGEGADVVVVVKGTATINGDVRTLVIVEGTAVLNGVHADTIWAIRSTLTLQPGTVVSGDVKTLDATVNRAVDAAVLGDVTEMTPTLIALGTILAPVAILFWLGFGLATLVAGLGLAALAARQVRETERIISREPVVAAIVGIAGLILVPLVAVLLMVSIVGAPLGLGILLGAWPLLAFLGYLAAGIWVGDWVLARAQPGKVRERPYLASVVGLFLLQVVGLVPILGLVSAIASLLGFGAVIVLGWRTLVGHPGTPQAMAGPAPAPAPVAG
jgi:hypothetical protein